MMNMIKIFAVLLSAAGFVLTGAEPLTVSCTTYPVWLLTREITRGADGVKTELMIPAGTGCPHDYVLTPADMRKLGAKNLLVVRNGLGMDDFVLKPLAKMNPRAKVIEACEGLPVLYAECGCSHDHGHKEDHGHHKHSIANPHLFASPDSALGMVGKITLGLCKADPDRAGVYWKNEAVFVRKLRGLLAEMDQLRPKVSGKNIAVQHGIFDYLANSLELKTAVEIHGEGIAPSAAEMGKMARLIRKQKVAVIFTEPQYSAGTARTLARECGIKTVQLEPLASGPADPPEDHYVKVMRENLKKIRSVLAQ